MEKVGSLMLVAISIIVGVILMSSVADNTAAVTQTRIATNDSVTAGAENISVTLKGQDIVGDPVILNATSNKVVVSNFTVVSTVSNGNKILVMTTKPGAVYAGQAVKVSYTYQPYGYVDGGSNVVIQLVVIFFAMAIMVVPLYIVLQEKGIL